MNGRIHDIRGIAEGLGDSGVYPGCGSACMLLKSPCNYGACIDYYDYFKCNCTVSPNDGRYCGNGKQFLDHGRVISSDHFHIFNYDTISYFQMILRDKFEG